MTRDEHIEEMLKRITHYMNDNSFTSIVCQRCGANAEIKQLYDSHGNPAKGVKFVYPLCKEEI